jgi:hypothetical protein
MNTMKNIKLIVVATLLAFLSSSCTISFLPPVAGGGCGIQGGGYGYSGGFQGGRPPMMSGYQPRFSGQQPGFSGQPGFHTPGGQQYGGNVARHPSGYPLMYQPGSRLPAGVSADPNSRYFAGKYIRDSGTYNSDRPGLNYTSGGRTVHVRN